MLAIDIGTSSVRALVYDGALRLVPGAESHRPHHPRVTADGGAELDARALTRAVARCVDDALAGAGKREFAAVGVSSFWHGLVATDAALRPLTPIYLWSDGRAFEEAAALRRRLDEREVHRRTGCRLHPTYWPAKIAWLRRRDRTLRGSATRWSSPVDLLAAELCGELVTSASLASGTGLYGLRRAGWDGGLLAALDITAGSLPPVSSEPRWLQPAWSHRWPRLAGVPWVPALGDGAAANLGSGCLDEKRRALTVGTSAALRVMLAAPPRSLPASLWCYRAGPGRFVAGAALSSGGNLFEWLRETLAIDDVEAALRALKRPNSGRGELTFLPLLAGERSPGYALRATGAVAGLTQATSAVDLLWAGLESIAVELALLDRDLDRIAPAAQSIVASGAGLLANPTWLRMICDALGRPLRPSHAREASARGAALAALEAIGAAPAARFIDPGSGRPLRPSGSPKVRERYRAAMLRREALYRVLVGGRLLETATPAAPAHQVRRRTARE